MHNVLAARHFDSVTAHEAPVEHPRESDSQFARAMRRLAEQGHEADPHAAVAAFGSAF
jgi:hypothetical protein